MICTAGEGDLIFIAEFLFSRYLNNVFKMEGKKQVFIESSTDRNTSKSTSASKIDL